MGSDITSIRERKRILMPGRNIRANRTWKVCAFLLLLSAPLLGDARAWQDTIQLPTYEEGPANPEPQFYLYHPGDPVKYPYTQREGFTNNRAAHSWRALHIENEYLSCTVLPDLGGHLYSCLDKLSGQQIFHTPSSIKKASVGLRGAWISAGIELNFPVGHSWTTVSPVDFAISQNPDGSASAWVGDVDLVYGLQWRVEFVLRPGQAVLEQNVHLYNPAGVRRRFYWWSTAAFPKLDQKTQFLFPTHLIATHGLTDIDTWPVSAAGPDKSVTGNYKDGDGLFAHGSREPFMAIYNPKSRMAVAHFAPVSDLPGKKLWTWGLNGDIWARKELSDDNSTYVEMQSGVFENQETFGMLEPEQTRDFQEYWIPARDIGGVARANLNGVLNISRQGSARDQLLIEFDATHVITGAKVRLLDGDRVLSEESANLDPAHKLSLTKPVPADAHCTVQIADASGEILLAHTEDRIDAMAAAEVKLGPQAKRDVALENATSPADFLRAAEGAELNGTPGFARFDYISGLQNFPGNAALYKGMGRLAVSESRFGDAVDALSQAASNVRGDAEIAYYLGVARAGLGRDAEARKEWEAIPRESPWHAAAAVELIALRARAGDLPGALQLARDAAAQYPESIRAGGMEVALLRVTGASDKAKEEVARYRRLDPADAMLRMEALKQGGADADFWPHLAADPERVLNVAAAYMRMGLFSDALEALSHDYPAVPDPLWSEPGSPLPQNHPLIAYYRGYCRMRSGGSGHADFQAGSALSTRYIFPHRATDFTVLDAGLKDNPRDTTALLLLGEAYLASEDVDRAVECWQRARGAHSKQPELYKYLGRALLELKKNRWDSVDVFEEGLALDPSDLDMKKGLQASIGPREKMPLISAPAAAPAPAPNFTSRNAPAPVKAPAPPSPARLTAPSASAPAPKPIAPSAASVIPQPGSTARAFSAYALALAADGKLKDAFEVFNVSNFPSEKQEEFVREAYLEVQARQILQMAEEKRCLEALVAADHFGDEDRDLPFTFHGFNALLKSPRLQFYFGAAESLCGDDKGAKKTWSKVAKSARDLNDADFAYPLIASALISANEGDARARIEEALVHLKDAPATDGNRANLLYSQGLLFRALGREKDAMHYFVEAAKSSDAPLTSYLARAALTEGARLRLATVR